MTEAEVGFRVAEAADAESLSALGTQVFLDTYARSGIRPAVAREVASLFGVAAVVARLREPGQRTLLAERGGHLVAFAEIVVGARHPLVPPGAAAELGRLYVQSPFLRRGIGRRLLAQAEALAGRTGRLYTLAHGLGRQRAGTRVLCEPGLRAARQHRLRVRRRGLREPGVREGAARPGLTLPRTPLRRPRDRKASMTPERQNEPARTLRAAIGHRARRDRHGRGGLRVPRHRSPARARRRATPSTRTGRSRCPSKWQLGAVAGVASTGATTSGSSSGRHADRRRARRGVRPARAACCVPAPSVIEFDADGNVLRRWGMPGSGFDFPKREHGIYVDPAGQRLDRRQPRPRSPGPQVHGDGKFLLPDRQGRPDRRQQRHPLARQAGAHGDGSPRPTSCTSPTATATGA
jgi:GNAT superfamily N-acetyltransferase